MEELKQPECINEQAVIDALDSKGIEDVEAKALLGNFAVQCETEANAEIALNWEDPKVHNRANIKAQIKVGRLLSRTQKYKEEARASLEEAYYTASQDESTADLLAEIDKLISDLAQ